jgi:hypothetical protein
MQNAEWRCVNVKSDEILTAYVWITKLVNVGNI